MLYFVKDNTLHRFPVPKRCGEERSKEPLGDAIPNGVKECIYCMQVTMGQPITTDSDEYRVFNP